jgi:hypothetical protein
MPILVRIEKPGQDMIHSHCISDATNNGRSNGHGRYEDVGEQGGGVHMIRCGIT